MSTGINDLSKEWERRHWIGDLSEAGEELNEIARTAWHPVSEPPTEADDADLTLVWREGWTEAQLVRVGMIRLMAERGDGYGVYWARQRDVVLLPPAATEGEA